MQTFTRTLMKTGLLLAACAAPMWGQQHRGFTLTGTVSGPTTVTLTWTAAAKANGYRVERAIGAASYAAATPERITATSYVDAAAPAGTELRYRIAATYKTGPNTFSNIVSVTTTAAPAGTASAPTPAAPTPGQPTLTVSPSQPTLAATTPLATATIEGPAPVALAPAAAPLPSSPTLAEPVATLEPLPTRERTSIAVIPAPAPTPVPLATPAPNTVTPVNPSGFVAKPVGDGKVQLSWQPIDGASYYVLLGAGIPDGGTRITGTTTFTATGVPPGTHEWAVASYYEPGPVSTAAAEFPRTRATVESMVLTGWVDLHTHPMVNLAFGGKLVHGGVDEGALLPQDLSCRGPTRATSMGHALGEDRPSHGGWNAFNFPCGDEFRKLLLGQFQQGNDALITNNPGRGYPDFLDWPKWDDITHQKMWYEWVRRARDGGLRVMVALATNNKTLGDAVAGPGDGPTDDKASADLQLTEIKAFVGRHPDFMEIALGAADVKRIVQANKIAVILGVEIDNIGNFNTFPSGLLSGASGEETASGRQIISGELQRLYNIGVRYVLPIHVVDNLFGGTAIYQDGFNTSNLREARHYWEIECANPGDAITYRYTDGYDVLRAAAAFVKIGLDPFRRSGPGPSCAGHRNKRGLTLQGIYAIKEMMKRGMIVDIDHMSHNSAEGTLEIAEKFEFPIVSGHSGIRGQGGANAENSRTKTQLERLSKLHGMFGLGSDGVSRSVWASQYQTAMNVMGYPNADPSKAIYRNGAIAFGTDLNGLVKGPMPGGGNRVVYNASFPKSSSGSKSWDYNTDGVVHYGMLSDFVMDVRTAPASGSIGAQGVPLGIPGSELVDNQLNRSANYFWHMWQAIEARKGNIQ